MPSTQGDSLKTAIQGKYAKLLHKHILIFGASKGLGYAVAEASLASGAHLTISSSSSSNISSTIASLTESFPNAKIAGHALDLSKPSVEDDITAFFEKVEGKVDHIVYTAADKLAAMPLTDVTREKIIAAGQLRVFAPLLIAKIGHKYMSPGPESSIVITTGSIWEKPIPDWTVVATYGGGICSMVRNLALDLKPIRVNAVSPGMTKTALWDGMEEEAREKMFADAAKQAPTGFVAEASDVAEAYVYLMKDRNITGRIVSSDSGHLLV